MSDKPNSEKAHTDSLNVAMKSQIMSMLKDVIDDKGSDEEGIKDSIFDQSNNSDDEDFDYVETQSNTTVSHIGFARNQLEKSQTMKMTTPFVMPQGRGKDCDEPFEPSEFIRNTAKKFQTTTPGSALNPQGEGRVGGMSLFNPMFIRNNLQPSSTKTLRHALNYPETSVSITNKKKKVQRVTFNDNTSVLELETMLMASKQFDDSIYSKFQGCFAQLSKDQQTSRQCQLYLDNTPPHIIHLIFEEVKDRVAELLLVPYANYFCSKLFFCLSTSDRLAFLFNIVSIFDVLCKSKVATYPLQSIVDCLASTEEKEQIALASYKHLMKLAVDVYGTHVLERIITSFDYDLVKPISVFILDNFLFLAQNANGLCIVKRAIIRENKQSQFTRLKGELIANALLLIQNPYGNYALQTAIDNWDLSDSEGIMSQFIGKCILLSIQKYSSNVIERCIEKSAKFLSAFIDELSRSPCIAMLMANNFGCYVLQTALSNASLSSKWLLINIIQGNVCLITDRRLVFKWSTIISAHAKQCQSVGKGDKVYMYK